MQQVHCKVEKYIHSYLAAKEKRNIYSYFSKTFRHLNNKITIVLIHVYKR